MLIAKNVLQINIFVDDFIFNEILLNIDIFASNILRWVFDECLYFYIVAINNNNDQIINI